MKIDRRAFLAGSTAVLASAGAVTPAGAARTGGSIRRIATEEAFTTPEQMRAMDGLRRGAWRNLDLELWRGLTPDSSLGRRLDLEGERLQTMDENGVSMHVLSLTSPGVQMLDADTAVGVAADANDRVAELMKRHPGRFAGLASFAPQDPARAVKEMERAITRLGMNGFVVHSHTDNEYLDLPKYWPILEAAEALDAPLYIHPRCPSDAMAEPYRDYGIDRAMWGYQAETGLHAMRLILSGVFDRFPKLKIILGHMGESIPYNLWRIDYVYEAFKGRRNRVLSLKPSETFKRNFWITTSGVESVPVLEYCITTLGADRIMWAIDYPYQPTTPAVQFLDNAPISAADREKIYFRNAEQVFRIAALD